MAGTVKVITRCFFFNDLCPTATSATNCRFYYRGLTLFGPSCPAFSRHSSKYIQAHVSFGRLYKTSVILHPFHKSRNIHVVVYNNFFKCDDLLFYFKVESCENTGNQLNKNKNTESVVRISIQ
jgi:hypothetical protein